MLRTLSFVLSALLWLGNGSRVTNKVQSTKHKVRRTKHKRHLKFPRQLCLRASMP